MDANQTAAKYVFVDIVGFSHNRSVEAQTDIIGWLNAFVRQSLHGYAPSDRKLILLPTGDGICIVLVGDKHAFDAHLTVALHILTLIWQHNSREDIDDSRRFEVRVGLNQNIDNVVIDINGRRNIAGAGINEAQRIMDCADAGQILVGANVQSVLAQREKYIRCFLEYRAKVKHGEMLRVFQYIDDAPGLNYELPSRFIPLVNAPAKLNKWQAYYMMHCILHRSDLLEHKQYILREGAPLLMHFLALDSIARDDATPSEDPLQQAWGPGQSVKVRLEHYGELDTWVRVLCVAYIRGELGDLSYKCFERILGAPPIFVNETGRDRLAAEAPEVFAQLQLANGPRAANEPTPPKEA